VSPSRSKNESGRERAPR
jgi:hypothetical protein